MKGGKGGIDMDESTVLTWIRRNVTLERVKEAEETLSNWWFSINLLNLDKYFNSVLMENVYRGYKGSFKIDSSKVRGLTFLGLILYTLFGEPKIDYSRVINEENSAKIKKVLQKHFRKNSYFLRYSLKLISLKTGDLNKKTGWINIVPYTYPLLGAEIFYYCTLRALIEISKKALKNKNYNFPRFINWKEGIIDYLINEIE